MELDDIITLAEAAEILENAVSAVTLRHQAQDGRIAARNVGKTWITTRQEVERYRVEQLGRAGRPPVATATHPVPKGSATHPVPGHR